MKRLAIITLLCSLTTAIMAQTASYEAALAAFESYDFDRAEELLDAYARKRKKAAIEADKVVNPFDTTAIVDKVELLRESILLGQNMIARVEKVEVIDSLTVDAEGFYKFYRLSKAAGSLNDEFILPADRRSDALDPVYTTEDATTRLWASFGSDDNASIGVYESLQLADSQWTEPRLLFDRRSIFGDDSAFDGEIYAPFLMPDGMTLYFAADGPASLGGLDIFIARREGDTFLQPSNIGMPYNSTANDYMMAIDEVTGIGWWATDRNAPEGQVTIYLFVPSELRVNYAPDDTPDLASLARLDDIKATQTSGRDYQAMLRNLPARERETKVERVEFVVEMPDGSRVTSERQLRNIDARALTGRLAALTATVADNKATLASLRQKWSAGNQGVKSEILSLERSIEQDEATIKQLRNRIVTLEAGMD